jgi:hypothetical protein
VQTDVAKGHVKAQDAEAETRRLALEAMREATRQQEEQQAIDAAAERLRNAEAEYQAELARRSER